MTGARKSMQAGVAGWPVAHSLSPRLHGFWIAEHRLDASYVALPIKPEDFERVFAELPGRGFRGVNVTLPHKEAAFRLTSGHDAAARATGAVNTVVFDGGKALGRNTDVSGFTDLLKENGIASLNGQIVVVLGAGGAARAIVASVLTLGAGRVVLVNRTVEKAHSLAAFFGERVHGQDWSSLASALKGAALLVNTTSLGMVGEPPLTIDLATLPPETSVVDIVYRPLETPLLKQARARGLRAIDGLGMLMHQARPGFAAWFGVEPQVSPALRAHLIAALEGRG
jgi:shikimate dehydrogenase